MPQTTTRTPFRTPILAISGLLKFGFNLEKYEKKNTKVSTICFIEIISFKKKVVSSA